MDHLKRIQGLEYDQFARLLAQLLDLDSDTELRVSNLIKTFGISHFFNNLQTFSLNETDLDKMNALQLILKSLMNENNSNE